MLEEQGPESLNGAEWPPGATPHEMTPQPVVKAVHLGMRYGHVDVLKDVSFEVQQGDVFGFVGPNGAGKTTTIAAMLGLIRPTSGHIELFGHGPQDREGALARVGALIETPAFYPYLSGRENLQVLSRLRANVTEHRIAEVLELLGLDGVAAGKRFSHYSLGMKQRLGIAWAMVHEPELLVLDEPTNGLDPAGMVEIRELIRALAAAGRTIFISSHLLHELEHVCNRIAVIHHGEIVAEGSLDAILHGPPSVELVAGQPERARLVLERCEGVERVDQDGNRLQVVAPALSTADINARLVSAGVQVFELRAVGGSLEARFLQLINSRRTDESPRETVRLT